MAVNIIQLLRKSRWPLNAAFGVHKEKGGVNMNCCICGTKIVGKHGNNPWPVKDKGQCCDICNITVVLKKRIEMLNQRKEEK